MVSKRMKRLIVYKLSTFGVLHKAIIRVVDAFIVKCVLKHKFVFVGFVEIVVEVLHIFMKIPHFGSYFALLLLRKTKFALTVKF